MRLGLGEDAGWGERSSVNGPRQVREGKQSPSDHPSQGTGAKFDFMVLGEESDAQEVDLSRVSRVFGEPRPSGIG
jgi:hypothetical protein